MVLKKNREKLIRMKKRAKKRGLDFNLDIKWLDEKFSRIVCEATGVDFIINDDVIINPNHPSIDRIDSNKGYTKDNCRIVTMIYNVAKGDQSEEVLIEWSKLFVEKYENEVMLEKSV